MVAYETFHISTLTFSITSIQLCLMLGSLGSLNFFPNPASIVLLAILITTMINHYLVLKRNMNQYFKNYIMSSHQKASAENCTTLYKLTSDSGLLSRPSFKYTMAETNKEDVLLARLYRVYLLHLLCSRNTVPGTEFRELHFLLVVP